MATTLKRLWDDEKGVTLIEYGLLAALLGVAVIATLILVRNGLVDVFSTVATALS